MRRLPHGVDQLRRRRARAQSPHARIDFEVPRQPTARCCSHTIEIAQPDERVNHRREATLHDCLTLESKKIAHHKDVRVYAGVAQFDALVRRTHRQPARACGVQTPPYLARAVTVRVRFHRW